LFLAAIGKLGPAEIRAPDEIARPKPIRGFGGKPGRGVAKLPFILISRLHLVTMALEGRDRPGPREKENK